MACGAHSTSGVYQECFLGSPKLNPPLGSFLGFGDPRKHSGYTPDVLRAPRPI